MPESSHSAWASFSGPDHLCYHQTLGLALRIQLRVDPLPGDGLRAVSGVAPARAISSVSVPACAAGRFLVINWVPSPQSHATDEIVSSWLSAIS